MYIVVHVIYSAFILQEDQGVYHGKVRDMITRNECRLLVNVNDLRRKNEKRANLYVNN